MAAEAPATSSRVYRGWGELPEACLLGLIPVDVAVGMFSWLAPSELGRLSSTCNTLRYLALDDALWEPLAVARFSGESGSVERDAAYAWCAEYKWMLQSQQRSNAYKRALSMGRVGRLPPMPSKWGVPPLSYIDLETRAASAGTTKFAIELLDDGMVDDSAVKSVSTQPSESVHLTKRQGSCTWSALGT